MLATWWAWLLGMAADKRLFDRVKGRQRQLATCSPLPEKPTTWQIWHHTDCLRHQRDTPTKPPPAPHPPLKPTDLANPTLQDESRAILSSINCWKRISSGIENTTAQKIEAAPPKQPPLNISVNFTKPSSIVAPRVNILLIGDSRDRFLYHEILQPLCGAGGALTSWWNPSKTTKFTGLGQTKVRGIMNFEVRHGQTCDPTSSLASIGFMGHYGVANSHYIEAYKVHGHEGWDGPGWPHDHKNINSPALIVEAARRFLNTSNCDGRSGGSCVVVFSSMLWDIARHCSSFPQLSVELWGGDFMTHYSAVALRLQEEIHRYHGRNAHLLLTTGYLSRENRDPYLKPGGGSCNTPRYFEGATHVVARRVAAQLNVPLLDFATIFSDLFPLLASKYLRDNIHANTLGLRIQWAAVRATLEACVSPPY